MRILLRLLITLAFLTVLNGVLYAQDAIKRGSGIPVDCGAKPEEEFTDNFQEITYKIDLKAGSVLDVTLVPLGEQLFTNILVTGPTNLGIALAKGEIGPTALFWVEVESQPKIRTGKLSASGTYTIRLVNFSVNWINPYTYATDSYRYVAASGGIGAFTLNIGCTLPDGTVIKPGDNVSTANSTELSTSLSDSSTFSGIGFPGLKAVDFTGLKPKTLTSNKSVIGAVDGNTITSYTIDAAANDTLGLEFTRASGNLNLGLVVLSADNNVVFQASLVTSSELTTKFTLPTAGTYTIGIFRIDLLPPTVPEATAFQLTATLNP